MHFKSDLKKKKEESYQGAAAVAVGYEIHVIGRYFGRHFIFLSNNTFIQARHMESVGLDLAVFIPSNNSSRVSPILQPL